MEKIINYFKSSYAEMKKISWPTKKQTINYSLLVIIMSAGFALFFTLLDYIFSNGFETLISK